MSKEKRKQFERNRRMSAKEKTKRWKKYRRHGEKQIAERGHCQVPRMVSIHPSFDPRSGGLRLIVGLDEHGHVWEFFPKDKAKMTPATWVKLTTRGKDATGSNQLPQWSPELYDRTNVKE